MNLNQELLDTVLKTQTEMLRISRTHYEKEILPILEDTRRELVNRLSVLQNKNNAEQIEVARTLFLQTDELINDYYSKIGEVNVNRVLDSAKITQEQINDIFNKDVQIARVLSVSKLEKLATDTVFGSEINKHSAGFWWKRQSKYLQKNYRKKVSGLIASESDYKTIIKAIRGTAKNKYTDGIMNITYSQAKALARSSVINVSNATRREYYASNQDVIKGIKWISTLDNRTSIICASLDGLVWTLPDYKPEGHGFSYPGDTAHFNCRSTQVPVLRSYEEILSTGKKQEIKEAGLRSSYTGAVPQDLSYSTFLKKQGAEFQNEVLGIQRAELFRKGTDIKDLINKDFEVIPLRELSE